MPTGRAAPSRRLVSAGWLAGGLAGSSGTGTCRQPPGTEDRMRGQRPRSIYTRPPAQAAAPRLRERAWRVAKCPKGSGACLLLHTWLL